MSTQVISFHCVLKNKIGTVIGTTFNHEVINSIQGKGSVLSGLVEGLQNIKKGEKRSIYLTAEKAYGFYDPKKIIYFPRNKFKKNKSLHVGDTASLILKNGQLQTFKIVEVSHDVVALDGNHPLAGQDLIFEIEATEARDATPDELLDADESDPDLILH